jgi:hypothetical protein
MTFLHPFLLAGLAGMAVPVIIHILTRDRIRRVEFSTLRFFVRASEKVLQRKRLREMLLLALRMAFCALLAIAFARPLLQKIDADGAASITARHAHVILLDNSASMATQHAAALKQARETASSLSASDAAALITFAGHPHEVVPMTKTTRAIPAAIDDLQPGQGGTDLAAALKLADRILERTVAPKKKITLISDMQRSAWRRFKGQWKLSSGAQLEIRPIKHEDEIGNIGIVEADVPAKSVLDKLPRAISVRIANFSDRRQDDVEVTLTINDEKIGTQKIAIRSNASVPVRFRHTFETIGDHPGSVSIAAEDWIPADNTYYFNARIVPKIRILIVTSNAGSGRYLQYALEPPGANSPFAARLVGVSQVKPEDIADAMVVIAADLHQVEPPFAEAIHALLQRGGGLFFVPGNTVVAERFNQTFADMSPAKLRRKRVSLSAGGKGKAIGWTQIDFEHPIFEVFQRPHHGDLSSPRFSRHWEVTDSQLSRVLARYDDGTPALLERQIGQGISLLLTSSLDGEWNDLPVESGAIFVSFIHQTMRHLAFRGDTRANFTIGEQPPTDAPITAPGIYTSGEEKYVVNIDLHEGDPTPLSPEELTAAIVPAPGEVWQTNQQSKAIDRKDERGIWWYILAFGVLLLFAELSLGNSTVRH